jgi:imidazole glycerol-phosphate synthase subunit HisH
MSLNVGVVDAGIGTWPSSIKMIDSLGYRVSRVSQPQDLNSFTHIVLPGVGNFEAASRKLEEGGWMEAIRNVAQLGKPLLGICLGMQLLGNSSEEGQGHGLGLLDFRSERLEAVGPRRVPNIGWASVEQVRKHDLFRDFEAEARFYFVHSYAVPENAPSCLGITLHNNEFASVVSHENVIGVQFHPEKSHRFGMKLFENFLELVV